MSDFWQFYLLFVTGAFIAHITFMSIVVFAISCFNVKKFKQYFHMLLGGAIGCSIGIAIMLPIIYFTR